MRNRIFGMNLVWLAGGNDELNGRRKAAGDDFDSLLRIREC